jgi:pyruvate kinase
LDDAKGDKNRCQLPHPEIIKATEVGHFLLIDDGKVKLRVVAKGDNYLECNVDVPGKIKDRKGVNTPDSVLEISPLTPKDRSDLEYMLGIGVDWVALSFVQTPADIDEINALIDEKLPAGAFRPAVMAKIEKPSCFLGDNLKEMVARCDGIMVARGDLGVECPPEDVPILQKEIIDECRKQGKVRKSMSRHVTLLSSSRMLSYLPVSKLQYPCFIVSRVCLSLFLTYPFIQQPVVVATQMLESMIESPTPTRAEASDVATAIYDGADAIMLSAESAAGMYPEEAVTMQQRIINRVESDKHYRSYLNQNAPVPDDTPTDAIITAARQIAKTIKAKAIVCFSLRGSTVLRASKTRPGVPIMALCPFKETSRQLALAWGGKPVVVLSLLLKQRLCC